MLVLAVQEKDWKDTACDDTSKPLCRIVALRSIVGPEIRDGITHYRSNIDVQRILQYPQSIVRAALDRTYSPLPP